MTKKQLEKLLWKSARAYEAWQKAIVVRDKAIIKADWAWSEHVRLQQAAKKAYEEVPTKR